MVERDGEVRFRMMDRLTVEWLRDVIMENADLSCRIITDEYPISIDQSERYSRVVTNTSSIQWVNT